MGPDSRVQLTSRPLVIALLASFMTACNDPVRVAAPVGPTPISSSQTRIINLIGGTLVQYFADGSIELTFSIQNSGNSPLVVSGVEISDIVAPYAVFSWRSGVIDPGRRQLVTVRFSEVAPREFVATIVITSNHTGGVNTIVVSASARR